MTIYWIISYTILLFCLFELVSINQLKEARTKNVITYLFLIATLMLILFGGMRGPNSGIDDGQYLSFFRDFSAQTRISDFAEIARIYRYESFFTLLAGLVSLFTRESYYFLFFICLIAVSTNARYIKRYSPLVLCSLCLYSTHLFLNKDMNQIRFGLSCAFSVCCLLLAWERKWLWAGLMFVLSTQSHSTAYALILIIPFLFLRERKYWPLLMVLVAIPLGLIGGKRIFLDSLGLAGVVGDRVAGYEGTIFDKNSPVFGLANIKNIAFITFFMVVYWGKAQIRPEERLVYFLLIVYAVGSAVRIIFADFSILGGRVGNLFLHVEPLLLAFLMMRIRNLILNIGLLVAMSSYYLAYNTHLSVQSLYGYTLAPVFRIF